MHEADQRARADMQLHAAQQTREDKGVPEDTYPYFVWNSGLHLMRALQN